MARKRSAYVSPPDTLIQGLVHPLEAAVYEFIDSNYDQLSRQYTQARLKSRRGQPPTETELSSLETEAEKFMDDVLPQKIMSGIDLDRVGYARFIEQRLSDIFLSGIAEKAMSGHELPRAASSIEAIAVRISSRKP